MSTTTTIPTWKSPSQTHSHSHSHSRSSHSRSSTTPRPLPAHSAGQALSPMLSPTARNDKSTHKPRSPSPSYFGLVIGNNADPPDSNPGYYARQNWDNHSAQSRSSATPKTVPVEANPDHADFRRRSELNSFTLSHGNLSSFSRPSQSKPISSPASRRPIDTETPLSPHSASKSSWREGPDRDHGQSKISKFSEPSVFDVPRHDSPAMMSPSLSDHQHARLSLPLNKLQTPPIDTSRQPQRADTLPPGLTYDNPSMISPLQLQGLLDSLPHKLFLLLDLRVYPQYAGSRIQGALNLCIPTTLLKRPSFTVQKLADTFTNENHHAQFARWRECRYIVVYDANSAQMKDAVTSVNVLKKFASEGWKGYGVVIKGGFNALSRMIPGSVDNNPLRSNEGPAKKGLTLETSSSSASVAGGCPMPSSKSAVNPFFGNIRQNMDLIDGVGQIPIKCPANMSDEVKRALPRWLRDVADSRDQGKTVSERFLAIEKAEQKRMQTALSGYVSYGSPRDRSSKQIQIAGIEKGSKNRYNNIFPYDHTRVRLQGIENDDCDYINANWVKSSYTKRRYIATQAPVPATFEDFWRVAWEQDARVIVMLTAESEGGQIKSHPYWHSGSYGPLKLKLLSERRVSLDSNATRSTHTAQKRPSIGQRRSTNPHTLTEKSSAFEQSTSSADADAHSVVIRHFTLAHSALPFAPLRDITQLHYSGWPDFGTLADPTHLLALIERMNKYARAAGSPESLHRESRHPVVVHCSAGCGRTGTFCTVDTVIDMLRRQREVGLQARYGREEDSMDIDIDSQDDWIRQEGVDLVAKTVEDFRLQRLSMVQNLRQFVLCYETVLQWITEEGFVSVRDGGRGGEKAERPSLLGMTGKDGGGRRSSQG